MKINSLINLNSNFSKNKNKRNNKIKNIQSTNSLSGFWKNSNYYNKYQNNIPKNNTKYFSSYATNRFYKHKSEQYQSCVSLTRNLKGNDIKNIIKRRRRLIASSVEKENSKNKIDINNQKSYQNSYKCDICGIDYNINEECYYCSLCDYSCCKICLESRIANDFKETENNLDDNKENEKENLNLKENMKMEQEEQEMQPLQNIDEIQPSPNEMKEQ